MKLCRDCKHYHADSWAHLDKCDNPEYAPATDPVRGRTGRPYCDDMRRLGNHCGPDAAGFEAKAKVAE